MLMAHSSFHYAIGMTAGIIICMPLTVRRWKENKPLFHILLFQFICANFLGVWATLPVFLVKAGLSHCLLSHPSANFFFFYPVINKLASGSTYYGPVMIIALFMFHYFLVIVAIYRVKKRRKTDGVIE